MNNEIKILEKSWKEALKLNDSERMLLIEQELIPRYFDVGINPDDRFHEMTLSG